MSKPLTKPHALTMRLTPDQKGQLDWLRRTGLWQTLLEEDGGEDVKPFGPVDLAAFYDNDGNHFDPAGEQAAMDAAMARSEPSVTDVVVGAIRLTHAMLHRSGPLEEITEESDLVRAARAERTRERLREIMLGDINHIEVPPGLSRDEAATHLRSLVRMVRTIRARETVERQRRESARQGDSA